MIVLKVEPSDGPPERVELVDPYVVVCGFTGRDPDQIAAHIEELKEIGVEPPASVPIFIPIPGDLLQQPDGTFELASATTSGEAEPVLVRLDGRYLFAVGSDHTDRALEAESIAAGKEACPKIVSTVAWPFEEVSDRWDRLELSATLNGSSDPVVAGKLASVTHPEDLIARLEQELELPDDRPVVLFLGTLAGGHADGPVHRFTASLRDPDTGRSLVCAYDIQEPSA